MAGQKSGDRQQPGNYVSHQFDGRAVRLELDDGQKISVKPLQDDILQIAKLAAGDSLYGPTLSILPLDLHVSVAFFEDAENLYLQYGQNELVITKQPLAFSLKRDGMDAAGPVGPFYETTGKLAVELHLEDGERIHGFGFQALPVDRRGYRLSLYNQSRYGYGSSGYTQDLNTNIPWFSSSRNYGIYFDHRYPAVADIGYTTPDVMKYEVLGERLAYYVITGEDRAELVKGYTSLTGRQPLPPRWALGYIQSKFGYRNQAEAESIVAEIRDAGFPLDALVLDLYWFGDPSEMGDLEWEEEDWPDPVGMMQSFRDQGIKTVLITEPYVTTGSDNFDQVFGFRYLALDSNSQSPYVIPDFWAGPAGLLDLTDPQVQDWMWQFYNARILEGVSGWWCDLGEPELHPSFLLHEAGDALEVHNSFSLIWAKMLWDRYRENYPEQRLFNLIRSGYAGMQRYGAIPWSGDVFRNFNALYLQIPIMLGMGESGVAYMHSDVGGFTGGLVPDPELYLRWVQMGCFAPVLRMHGVSAPTEPVAYDPAIQDIVREFIRLRYRLLPYNYSLAYENSISGAPLARSMSWNYADLSLENIDDQYMWGSEILVAPVVNRGEDQRRVILPPGNWYNFWSGERYEGNRSISLFHGIGRIPVFIREGAFIPMANDMAHTGLYRGDTLNIHYYPGSGATEYSMYNDDGKDPQALDSGHYERLVFTADPQGDRIYFSLEHTGDFPGMPSSRELTFHIYNTDGTEEVWVSDTLVRDFDQRDAFAESRQGTWYNRETSSLLFKFRWPNLPSLFELRGINTSAENKISSSSLSIYPNPARGEFLLDVEGDWGDDPEFRLFDLYGEDISFHVSKAGKDYRFEILNPVPGACFLEIKISGYLYILKMIRI